MSLLTIEALTKKKIMKLILRAEEFRKGMNAKVSLPIVNIFDEASTRTNMSFAKAETNLGMDIFELPPNSSHSKGETMSDTVENLFAMGMNNFVIRSSNNYYWEQFSNRNINIINAGDGTSNHPTQALLDALTIYQEFGTLENLRIAIIGDLKYSRVYWSNKELLEKFNSIVHNVAPRELFVGDQSRNQKLDDIIKKLDVVMFLRIQRERHHARFSIDDYNHKFGLNAQRVKLLKEKAIFMHPGPINQGVEMTEEISFNHPKSRILKQVENGVYMRMAILEMFCKQKNNDRIY